MRFNKLEIDPSKNPAILDRALGRVSLPVDYQIVIQPRETGGS